MSLRLAVIQFGDYRAALHARQAGEPETYKAQYYSMQVVEHWIQQGWGMIISLDTESYDERIGRLRLIGGRFAPRASGLQYYRVARRSARILIGYLQDFRPTHLLIRTPGWVVTQVGGWAIKDGISVLPVLADYFSAQGWKNRLKNRQSARVLNHPLVPCVCNHNVPASQSMVRAGVQPWKIVAYDWPPQRRPEEHPQKSLPAQGHRASLVFAGSVSQAKGVGDILAAVDALVNKGWVLDVHICGSGPDMDQFMRRAGESVSGRFVHFHGQLSNARVLDLMAQATLVLVPSRHEYPEGLPNVIYEAFETRTPVICSDHPSFVQVLHSQEGCLMVREKCPELLAQAVRRVLASNSVYARLSRTTMDAWRRLQCSVTFDQVIQTWMDGRDETWNRLLRTGY